MTAAAEMGDTAALALAGAVTSGAGSLSGLGASREAGRAEPSQTHSARQVAPAEAGLVVVGPLPAAYGGAVATTQSFGGLRGALLQFGGLQGLGFMGQGCSSV